MISKTDHRLYISLRCKVTSTIHLTSSDTGLYGSETKIYYALRKLYRHLH